MTTFLEAADLVASLRSTDVFGSLRDGQLQELAGRMRLSTLAAGEVIAPPQSAHNLYLVLAGVVAVGTPDRTGAAPLTQDFGPGSLVGEMNVISSQTAPIRVEARTPVRLAALSRQGFREFFERHPASELEVIEALRPRLRRHRLWNALLASEMFRDVERTVLLDLASEFELVALYGGETLFRQGDPGESLFIVVTGRLKVVAGDPDAESLVAELGGGETVGEMAVISGEPRSATVYAARDTQLARLSQDSVRRLTDRHPHAMLRMLTGPLVKRLRSQSGTERRRASVATLAVVPAGPEVDLAAFVERFVASLSRLGPALLLSGPAVDSRFGREGAAQAHDREGGGTGLLEWLAEQEIEHRFVVYQTDRGLSPWTERCLRQADRIVLVANASGDPSPGEIESELVAGLSGRRTPAALALVHPDDAAVPTATGRWLAGRNVARHAHLRRSNALDYDRFARILTGNAIGLALGGGFARGLAHLGVLRALHDLHVPVDAVGGASMGAMVGAQAVLEWDHARIGREMRTGFAESFDDMTLPFLSFKRGGKASRFIRSLFGDVRIEDLWLPFFAVSANLNRAELKVHTSGSLANAVLASSRAPGIFPPLVMDGELHVDGGLINNVPVDVMKSFCNEGFVIGVDVSPPHELNHVADYGDDMSGWRAIWHRFNPTRDKRIYRPSILLVLMRVIEFGGIAYRREKAAMADVYISPDVLRFKRNDFHAAADIAEAGYRAAREVVTRWLASAPRDVRLRRPDLFPAASDAGAPGPADSRSTTPDE